MFIQTINKKKALRFESKDQSNVNKAVLFLTWFPKYPWNSKFIELFIRQGYNVLCPMYSGTFESDGLFSIEESVSDAKLRYDFLLNWTFDLSVLGDNKKEYDISEIILCWVSYGWLVLSLFLDSYQLLEWKKAFFISMLGYGFLNKNNLTYIEEADNSKKLLEVAFPFSYRLENVDRFFNQIKWNMNIDLKLDETINHTLKKILIHWSDDVMTPINIPEFYCNNHDNCELNPLEWWHSGKMDIIKLEDLIHKYL